MKTPRNPFRKAMLLVAGGVLTVAAVAVLSGCDHHRARIRYDTYYEDVPVYHSPQVVVVPRPVPLRRPPVAVYGGHRPDYGRHHGPGGSGFGRSRGRGHH